MPGGFPSFPGGLPGPVPGPGSPGIGLVGPSMPAGLFPTTVKWGDVVNVTGPFAGKFQGQVLVRFAGVGAVAPALTGPFGGSVVVPDGAQTGACTIEVDGRTVFGTNCVVSSSSGFVGRPARAPEHRGFRAWHDVGQGTQLALAGDSSMAYVNDGTSRTRGVGAVAAADLGKQRRTRILTGAGVMTLGPPLGLFETGATRSYGTTSGPKTPPPKTKFIRQVTFTPARPPRPTRQIVKTIPAGRRNTVVVVTRPPTGSGGGADAGGTTSSGGGGATTSYGGGGGGGGGGGAFLDETPPGAAVEIPEADETVAAAGMSRNKKIAIGAAVAVAAYFLVVKGKKRR